MPTHQSLGHHRSDSNDRTAKVRKRRQSPTLLGSAVDVIESYMGCPWPAHAGSTSLRHARAAQGIQPLYTPEERLRRDASPWTIVQAILAPLQFIVFAVSLYLVFQFLSTGRGYELATMSIVAKTLILYTIMITGSIWEKEVFGKWLFAKPFFWEDVFSMLVLGLQTIYLAALIFGWGSPQDQMMIAIGAYAAYVINAGQFVWKLRMARLEGVAAARSPTAASTRAAS